MLAENAIVSTPPEVALRKESVDRNVQPVDTAAIIKGVALRKESVDRNYTQLEQMLDDKGRSPQGERG